MGHQFSGEKFVPQCLQCSLDVFVYSGLSLIRSLGKAWPRATAAALLQDPPGTHGFPWALSSLASRALLQTGLGGAGIGN